MDYSIISLFTSATLVAKIVMGILVAMSVMSWAVIIGKFFSLGAAERKAASGLARFNEAPDLRQALQSLGAYPSSPLYAVAQHGVREFNNGKEAGVDESVVVETVRRALNQGVGQELDRLHKSLSILATAANTAPFIGLFGTVWGIMTSFHAIGQMKSASLATVAPGISEALIATAVVGVFFIIVCLARPWALPWMFPPPSPTICSSASSTASRPASSTSRACSSTASSAKSTPIARAATGRSAMPRKKRFVSEINVTPFVDVMMVLLIIFMVTAPMMDSGLDVELPQAKQVDNLPTDADHLVLTIREDGALFLDTYQVKLEELEPRLTELVRDKGRALFLQADKAVPYGVVVDVMGRIKAAGIDFLSLPEQPADDLLGAYTGAGTIFGVTGGVMEAALRTAYCLITKEATPPSIDFKEVRGMEGVKSATIKIGDAEVNVAIAHQMGNVEKVLNQIREDLKNGVKPRYDFIEVMACRGGCVGGGGQPCLATDEVRAARTAGLYTDDEKSTLRMSHLNPEVQSLYKDYLGEPGSEKAEELLHTHYHKRELYKFTK
mgnify:CR=1 FL=1